MTIATATELREAITAYTHSDDLTAQYDNWIGLVEARFNRALRVRAMENTLASTALSSGAVTLPAGFLAFKELRYDGDPTYTLEPRPLEWIRNQDDEGGRPVFFAVANTQVVCSGQSGSITGTYYKALDSLVSNSTNWLLTSHPDLYLFACLEESAIFTRDYEAGKLWGTRAQVLLSEIQSADNGNSINGGPLTARAR